MNAKVGYEAPGVRRGSGGKARLRVGRGSGGKARLRVGRGSVRAALGASSSAQAELRPTVLPVSSTLMFAFASSRIPSGQKQPLTISSALADPQLRLALARRSVISR
jgi:hypothetical protein